MQQIYRRTPMPKTPLGSCFWNFLLITDNKMVFIFIDVHLIVRDAFK